MSVCCNTAQALVFLLVSVCCDTAQAMLLLLVSVCCDTAQALMLLLVSVCCDTAQALMLLLVSVCCDTAQATADQLAVNGFSPKMHQQTSNRTWKSVLPELQQGGSQTVQRGLTEGQGAQHLLQKVADFLPRLVLKTCTTHPYCSSTSEILLIFPPPKLRLQTFSNQQFLKKLTMMLIKVDNR